MHSVAWGHFNMNLSPEGCNHNFHKLQEDLDRAETINACSQVATSPCTLENKIKDYLILKADRPHLRDYPQMPTDYRHTDNHLSIISLLR